MLYFKSKWCYPFPGEGINNMREIGVMAMTAYGTLLRQLINFTGVKLYTVADVVGYDVSYISKWCNKDLLPAPKTAHYVGKTLGAYFAGMILKEGREDEFFELFTAAKAGKSLEQTIRRLLVGAYESSVCSKGQAGGVTLMTQRNEMRSCLRELFAKAMVQGGELVCTVDLLTLLKSRDFAMLSSIVAEKPVHLHAALDLGHFLQDPEQNMRTFYEFLSRRRTCFITLYDGAGLERENILAGRGDSALLASLTGHGELDALTRVDAGPPSSQLYDTALSRLKERPLLLAPALPEDMNRGGYRTDFYSRDQFKFFSPYGFEFLLPEVLGDRLVEAVDQAGLPSSMAGVVRRLFITWDEVFQKRRIDFYLLKSTVLQYLENGELLFADIPYRMSPAERLDHLEHIKAQIKSNHGIRFIVIDDGYFSADGAPAFSAYMNSQKLFLKRHLRCRNGDGPLFYIAHSDALIRAIGNFFDAMLEGPYCTIYDHRDVEELEARYGGMLQRMLSLGEE